MKETEHRSGTFFARLSVCICIADQHRGSWSSRSSSTAAAAQQQWWRRRRGSGGGELPYGELGCCFVSPLRSVCFVHPGPGPFTVAAWLFTAAAYLLRCCCCDDHGRRREEDPSPSDWNALPSEPSDPSHCLLERSTRSAGCLVANSITENTMIDLKHSNLNFLQSFFTLHFFPSRKKYVNEWLFHEDSRSTKAMNSKNGGDSFRSR